MAGGKIPADLVSLLRFTLGRDGNLVPHREVVRLRYDLWLTEQGGTERFSEPQLWWLQMIRDHIEESLTIEREDFDLDPLAQAGGLVGAYQAFGNQLDPILAKLNEQLGTQQGEYMGLPPTGKSVTYKEMFIFRFANDRIVETRGVVDVLSQVRQLGIKP